MIVIPYYLADRNPLRSTGGVVRETYLLMTTFAVVSITYMDARPLPQIILTGSSLTMFSVKNAPVT